MPINQKGRNSTWDAIHNALHDHNIVELMIGDIGYDISVHHNGCRFLSYQGIQFMEQNKNKILSPYAQLAREGHKITWGIRGAPEPWIFIKD